MAVVLVGRHYGVPAFFENAGTVGLSTPSSLSIGVAFHSKNGTGGAVDHF